MKISELGEFGFIDAIKEDTLFNPDPVVIGIGDDGAVYKTSEGMEQVAVIDTMVENRHSYTYCPVYGDCTGYGSRRSHFFIRWH